MENFSVLMAPIKKKNKDYYFKIKNNSVFQYYEKI